MSDRQPKRKAPKPEDVANLFRVLRNMARDEAVSDAHFRLAFRIAQTVDNSTGWGEAGHAFLMDEVPRTDKAKIRKFRRTMERELGWIRVIEGSRGRGTRYAFREDRCAAIEEAAERARDERHAQAALKKIQEDSALQVASLGGKILPLSENWDEPFGDENSPLIEPGIGVKSASKQGRGFTPTLPISSTSGLSAERVQDQAHRAHGSARAPARAVPPTCSCGEPAITELRIERGGPFRPTCEECRDDLIWLEQRPLRSSENGADSRADPAAAYVAAKDGV